jgi:glc operon protein GlcG
MELTIAQQHINTCIRIAESLRLRVAVVVVDGAGRQVAAARMDGVSYLMTSVAHKKANAAAQFKVPLNTFSEMLEKSPLLASSMQASADDIVVLPGGFPIVKVMTTIGGVGIAGGHYEQDHEIGRLALREIAEALVAPSSNGGGNA